MYHHHQQQGAQPFPSGPPPNQPPIHPQADMMPPAAGRYQFSQPTQLPDELESALSIRGSRDMDHRLIEHLDRLSKLQNQMGQPTNFSNSPQPKPQSMDWSSYEPPTKLFSSPTPGHTGSALPNWNSSVGESSASNPRGPIGRSFYTPESAGTILASFGLSNEDLEALSHYPDDQLTPDTLPFILRELQVHKTCKTKNAPSRSPEVPSLLTVTQTEGRVIDYGHASQAKEESGPPKSFKKEPISSERTVKMFPSPAPKLEASMGRQVRLEPADPIKHGDRDYRRRSNERHASRSPPPPPREFSTKPRHQDRDYRQEAPKPRASAEKRTAEPPVSKPRPALKPARTMTKTATSKKLPTPTMINDFSGVPPKVYPHTCSLCEMQCDQEKDWIEHLETVNHTAACRHLRSKYPSWKPKLPSREYGGKPVEHKRPSAGHSRSTSWSPPPPTDKLREPNYKPRGKGYAPHHGPRHHPYYNKDVDERYERAHPHGGSNLHQRPFREAWQKRERPEGPLRGFMKRPHYENKVFKGDPTKKTTMKYKPVALSSTSSKAEDGPPAKKKKVVAPYPPVIPTFQRKFIKCLVYLTDIPKEATEQEVINLAGSFGKIRNVLMMPFGDEEEHKDQLQQASVCMMEAKDADTFLNAPNLVIRDQVITATAGKIPKELLSEAEDGAQPLPEKKGVVLIEDLPESGWSEDDLKALAAPFEYPDDIIAAKHIGKAMLIFPDVATAVEMVKVNSFSPLTLNGNKLKIKQCSTNISLKTPVALYNCFMQPATTWHVLVVVSNVPSMPSAASVIHKLVSRIGTVIRSLALKNMVICELANVALSVSVRKHYLKFPCMIQSSLLVFSRKPDPKPLSKVIPAFLDADQDEPDVKSEAEATSAEPKVEAQQDVEMKSEPTETEVSKEEVKETSQLVEKQPAEEPAEPGTEAVKAEAVKAEAADGATEEETTNHKENGTPEKPAEEAPTVTEDMAPDSETATKAKETKAVSSEKKPQEKASKPPASGKKQAADPAKSSSSSSREVEKRRTERERYERERRERERVRKERDHDERNKRDHERERRGDGRREEQRREWRREWERKEGRRKPYDEDERRRRSSHHRSSSRKDTTEADEFPFNLSDFVTVDEVGDVDAPAETEPETGPGPENKTEANETVTESEPAQEPPQELLKATPEVKPEGPAEGKSEETICEAKTDTEEPSAETETETETKQSSAAVAEVNEEEETTAIDEGDVTEEPCAAAAEKTTATDHESQLDQPEAAAVTSENPENKEEEVVKEEVPTAEEGSAAEETETTAAPPAVEAEKLENSKEESVEVEVGDGPDDSLPPYDADNAVGLDYLVPMTGFYCKVCSRFFTGAKDTQISHSKTLKHYENLEKFLKSRQAAGST